MIVGESGGRATTDAGGVFHLAAVPSGPVVVRIERDGYVSPMERVEVAPLETTGVQFSSSR